MTYVYDPNGSWETVYLGKWNHKCDTCIHWMAGVWSQRVSDSWTFWQLWSHKGCRPRSCLRFSQCSSEQLGPNLKWQCQTLCLLSWWFLKAFLLEQKIPHLSQWKPADTICLDSTWLWQLLFLLDVKPQTLQSQVPSSCLDMLEWIAASSSGNRSQWKAEHLDRERWFLRASLVDRRLLQYWQRMPGWLMMCLASTCTFIVPFWCVT